MHGITRKVTAIGLIWALTTTGLFAQAIDEPPSVYLDVSTDARNKLRTLESYLRQEEWGEAVELLQNLVEGSSSKLIPVGPEAPHAFVDLGTFSQYRISRLPAEALRIYRDRVEGQAADLYKQFEETGNAAFLEKIADQFFSSSVAPKAMERLAELAVTRGNHGEALAAWKKILPKEFRPAARPGEIRLEHPDPKLDMPRVVAKYCITEILAGNISKAESTLEQMRAVYPTASGQLAGREGVYWEIVAELGRDPKVTRSAVEDKNWTTFAGNAARTKIAPTTIDVGDVQWKWTIDDEPESQPDPRLPFDGRGSSEETLAYHPAVVGQKAFLVTERYLTTFDLETGKMDRWYDFQGDHPHNRSHVDPRVRYTMTVDGDRLFVRMGGAVGMNQRMAPRRTPNNSALYCFDHRRQRLLWNKTSNSITENGDVIFEGAPLVQGENVYVAATRIDAMSQTSVACLEAASGKLKWRTLVCEATNELGTYSVSTNNLLTLADNTIFYGTNLGAVAALNARTGRLKWVSIYPRGKPITTRNMTSLTPDLNPCVHHQGKLFLAASDTAKIQCFDAETGRKLWDAHPPVAHLLGVAKGNLIVTGNRVWGIDVETGKIRWYWPENTVSSHGRGTLAGDYVYWPTKERIHVLDQATGKAARTPIELFDRLRLKAGNVVISGDHMLLAQSNRLLALVPYARLIEKLKQELVRNPHSGELHMRLADAALAIEDFSLAKTHLGAATTHAQPEEVYEGRPMTEFAKEQLFGVTLREAGAFAAKREYEHAQSLFEEAVRLAPTPTRRWEAFERHASMWMAADQPEKAARPCQAVLDDDELRDVLISPTGESHEDRQIPAEKWARETLARLIAEHGTRIYRAEEESLRESLLKTTSGDELLRLAIRHPNSESVGEILLRAAKDFETKGRWRDARLAYKRVHRLVQVSDVVRVESLFGLDRAYAAANLHAGRRPLLERLARDFGDRAAPPGFGSPGDLVRDVVQRELEMLGRVASGQQEIRLRALRRGERIDGGEERIGVVDGVPPSHAIPTLMLVSGKGQLAARTSRDPKPLWQVEFSGHPEWCAHSPTGLLVATSRRVQSLDYESGSVLWDWPLSENREDLSWTGATRRAREGSLEPTPEANASMETVTGSDVTFAGDDRRFALAGEVLLAISEEGKLLAVDGDEGLLLWRLAEQERFMPIVQRMGSIAVVSTERHLVGVDGFTGERRFRVPIRNGTAGQRVIEAEGKILAVVDRGTIQAITLEGPDAGKVAWSREFVWPSFQLPRLHGGGEKVLVSVDGYQLARLDPTSGEILWHRAIGSRPNLSRSLRASGVPEVPPADATASIEGDAMFYIHDDWFECREVRDGSLRYRRALPTGIDRWSVLAAGEAAVVLGASKHGARLLLWNLEAGRLSQTMTFSELGPLADWRAASDFAIFGDGEVSWVLNLKTESRKSSKGEVHE